MRLVGYGMLLALSVSTADAAVYALKAVKVGSAPIAPPAAVIDALPGDRIETEIFLSGWASDFPLGMWVFEAAIDGYEGARSGGRGAVLPCHWKVPLGDEVLCDTRVAQCPPDYPSCLPSTRTTNEGRCVASDENVDQCAFITTSRSDFVFEEVMFDAINATDLTSRYFALADHAVPDPGVPRYCGTMVLKAATDACGTFTIGFSEDQSFIGDENSPPNTVTPAVQSLTIQLPACPPELLSCDPGHCLIDTRIPHDPGNPVVRLNTNTLRMHFSAPTQGMTASDFEVSLLPNEGIRPMITSLTPDGDSATIVMNRRIATERWTCIRHVDSDRQCCLGSLPGDMNWSLLVSHTDIDALADNLDGLILPVLPAERCDTDRNGRCLPADLLMAVDLLTGAWTFAPSLGTVLPACPPFEP